MQEEKFVLCSFADQVIKIAFVDSTNVLLEDMPIYQCNCTCGKIALLILVIKPIRNEIVL